MTSEQNKAVLHCWMDAFSANDRALLDRLAGELYTPDYVIHDPGLPPLPPGPAGIRQFVEMVVQTMSISRFVDGKIAEEWQVGSPEREVAPG